MTATKGASKAVADLTAGTILATVEISAAPERVFRALTASDEVVRWWGADEAYRTTKWTADLRVGGKWRAEGVGADGKPFTVGGEYLEVDPPRTLVQTWAPDWDGGHVTTLTYRLEPTPLGTRVTVRHEGFAGRPASCEAHTAGWEAVLGWLGDHVRAPTAGGRRAFFVRLVAPRPTFMQDMTDEERAMMKEHGAYWRRHLDDGSVIVFGPVVDPAGAWGLGVVRAADEAGVRAFEREDPAVRSGRGFRYEILPMAAAVFRE